MIKYLLKLYKIIFFSLVILFVSTIAFADVIHLTDGSTTQGKLVRETDRLFFFTNSHGTFEILKVNVKKIYKTKSYKEDINHLKQFNPDIDEEVAKKNYEVGMRKKEIMRKSKVLKKYFEYWDYGRLSLSATYFATISEEVAGSKTINKRLPSGFSGQVTYEQGLDMLLYLGKGKSNGDEKAGSKRKFVKTKPRPLIMPGLRIEWSFLYFTKDLFVDNDREVSGSFYTIGPMWSLPSPHSVWGCFVFSIMPGVSFLNITNRETGVSKNGQPFALAMVLGYEYAIDGKFGLLFHARYTYIKDQQIDFHGIGASFGVAFRLW